MLTGNDHLCGLLGQLVTWAKHVFFSSPRKKLNRIIGDDDSLMIVQWPQLEVMFFFDSQKQGLRMSKM